MDDRSSLLRPNLVLVSILLLSSTSPSASLDGSVRDAVQSWRRPALEAPMDGVTSASRPLLIGGAVLALVGGATSRAVLLEAGVALAPVNLAVEALKWTVHRTRPDGSSRRANSAFPSSHVANAFAVAAVLVRRWRWTAWLTLPAAALVAFSRLYLNRHWFTDVVAGALLGFLLAWWVAGAFAEWKARRAKLAVS